MDEISKYLKPGSKVYIVGAGGVSMSALAEVLAGNGVIVSGSDRSPGAAVERLQKAGIKISIGESPEELGSPDCVIRTAAARDDNPLILSARARDIPVFERADAWGSIMLNYRQAVCIAGTHGKTSTTSMLAHIAIEAGADPTVMLGGYLPILEGGHRVGKGELIILEACEYCNSFLKFTPTVAVILNVEADHLDFFHSLDDIISSFCSFARKTPVDGRIIVNGNDSGASRVGELTGREVLEYGHSCFFHAENIQKEQGQTNLDIYLGSELFTHASLTVPGSHQIENALAASYAAYLLGIGGEAVRRGLLSYRGAARRMEYKRSLGPVPIYDDYAHHPTEIRASLQSARDMGFNRILCAFQPHTYTRTRALLDDFASVLSAADRVFLADIYAARENNTTGISSLDLAKLIPGCVYEPDFDSLAKIIRESARDGDVILTMGAGNINRLAELI